MYINCPIDLEYLKQMVQIKRKKTQPKQWTKQKKTKTENMSNGSERQSGYYGRYGFSNAKGTKVEKKFFDTRVHNQTITGGRVIAIDSLFKIQAGTGSSERVGRMIRVKGINVRGQITSNVKDPADCYRVVLYLDKQANGAAATLSELFAEGSVSGGGVNWLSFLNLVNSRRFKILRDVRLDSQSTIVRGTNDYGFDIKYFDMNVSLDLLVEYGTNGSSITDLKSANVGIAVMSAISTTTFEAGYQLLTRVRFTDV